MEVSRDQILRFRLSSHHLDRWYAAGDLVELAGVAGFQNTPPGTWETALWNRTRDLSRDGMRDLLERDKLLIQAWSLRGAPIVFPTTEREVFLRALQAAPGERWIYTDGSAAVLDHLGMELDEVLELLIRIMPELDGITVRGKDTLD